MNLVKLVENINLYRTRKIMETIPNYIEALTTEGFNTDDINEISRSPVQDHHLIIWSKFNLATAGMYNDIDSIKNYMNTHLTEGYKAILLSNLEKYDSATGYHVALQ